MKNIDNCWQEIVEWKAFFINTKHEQQQNPNKIVLAYQRMNGKSSIRIIQNHSETNVVKMKHHSVVMFEKLRRLDKYQH